MLFAHSEQGGIRRADEFFNPYSQNRARARARARTCLHASVAKTARFTTVVEIGKIYGFGLF